MKYFTPNFYFKKVAPYSQKICLKLKHYTKQQNFYTKSIFFIKPENFTPN